MLADPNEVFWLPLDAVRKDARGEAALGYAEAALALTAARSADAEARTNPPPLGAADTLDVGTDVVRGAPGAAGARIGPVRIYRGDHDHDHDGSHVLVARTLLPTELPLLSPARDCRRDGRRARSRRRAGARARHPGGRRRGGRLPRAARRRPGPGRRRRRPGRSARPSSSDAAER